MMLESLWNAYNSYVDNFDLKHFLQYGVYGEELGAIFLNLISNYGKETFHIITAIYSIYTFLGSKQTPPLKAVTNQHISIIIRIIEEDREAEYEVLEFPLNTLVTLKTLLDIYPRFKTYSFSRKTTFLNYHSILFDKDMLNVLKK
jgi:hypothetical protein